MVYITKFLGIYPEKNINNHLFFDLENGNVLVRIEIQQLAYQDKLLMIYPLY